MIKKGLKRVALVGTPCQIKSLRKMQVLNLIPSDSIKFCFGLFCSGNFTFGIREQQQLSDIAGFSWEDVSRINLKDKLIITLSSGENKTIELEQMEFMKRYACHYCSDYSALDMGEKFLTLLEFAVIVHLPLLMDSKGRGHDPHEFKLPEADVGLVSGGIKTRDHLETAKAMRDACDLIIAFGTCATHGGIPAMANSCLNGRQGEILTDPWSVSWIRGLSAWGPSPGTVAEGMGAWQDAS